MTVFLRGELRLTDLAHKLAFGAIILVKINAGGIATRTFTIVIDVTLRTTFNRFYGFEIIFVTPLKVSHEILVAPRLNIQDEWKFINLEFLVFR